MGKVLVYRFRVRFRYRIRIRVRVRVRVGSVRECDPLSILEMVRVRG